MNWDKENAEVSKIASEIKRLGWLVQEEENRAAEAEAHLSRCLAAQETLQHLAQAVQQKAHSKISEVVSSCLLSVFEDQTYDFVIEFERKRGKTEANLRFKRGDLNVDPLSSTGGGVVDVAAFALRMACLVLHRPRLSKVVVLDEPMKFVSKNYLENVKAMIEGLAADMGFQIILVTHISELEMGTVIEL